MLQYPLQDQILITGSFEDECEMKIKLDNEAKSIRLKSSKMIANLKGSTLTKSRTNLVDFSQYYENSKYMDLLLQGFHRISPLIYMNQEQKEIMMKKIKLTKTKNKEFLYLGGKNAEDNLNCYILLQGQIEFFNQSGDTFLELIHDIHFFGYDGPIFQSRFSTAQALENSVIGIIDRSTFLDIIQPLSEFATFLSRSILHKDKILDPLNQFKTLILDNLQGILNMEFVLKIYKKFNSILHLGSNSNEIDFKTWFYSLSRLPKNIFESYFILMIDHYPKAISTTEKISENLIRKSDCPLRNRDSYMCIEGKLVIIMRDMETDVLDFLSNLCVHIIESRKIIRHLSSASTLEKLFNCKNKFNPTIEILQRSLPKGLNEDEIMMLKKNFGDNLADVLMNLLIHQLEYTVSINSSAVIDKDPVEFWVENLWKFSRKVLELDCGLEEVDDLVVDIIQGSKKTFLNFLSPHIYSEKENILKWAESNQIKTNSQEYFNENDRLIALSNLYYRAFPEKNKEKIEMELEHGIIFIEKTFSTGVKVILINANKIHKNLHDSNINIKPASKNQLIILIGSTFGTQSYQIIIPLLMLFSHKIRSLNIIGKCGGLVGNCKEVVLANKIFSDKNHDFSNVDYGVIDKKQLEKEIRTKIHIGPMLTVAGTLIQNEYLLNFYRKVIGCVGVDMEGFYFAKEVENCKKHGLLQENLISRFFSYIADLPLDKDQNLSCKEVSSNWDEGLGTIYAISRFILKQILENY